MLTTILAALYIGFAQFDLGARLLMEFVDVQPETFEVGTRLRMRFASKSATNARLLPLLLEAAPTV